MIDPFGAFRPDPVLDTITIPRSQHDALMAEIQSLRDDLIDANQRGQEAEAKIDAHKTVLEALQELTDIVQAMMDGTYQPDAFTLQPALTALHAAGIDPSDNK